MFSTRLLNLSTGGLEVRETQTISSWQFMFLMLWLVGGSGLIIVPSAINYFAPVQDGWIAAAMSIVGVLISYSVYIAYTHVFPSCRIEVAFTMACGKWLGSACMIWVTLWAAIKCATALREWTAFIESNFFPSTPIYILALILACLCSYAVYSGLEVVARMAQLISPIIGIVLLMLMLLPLHHAHFEYLRPVFSSGWKPVVQAMIVPAAFNLELMLSIIVGESLKHARQGIRYLLYAGIAATGISILMQVISIVVLGASGASMNFPVLETVRSISFGEFMQRLDPFYVSISLAVIFIKVSVLEFVVVRSLQAIMRSRRYQDFVWGTGALLWAGSISLYRNTGDLWHFVLDSFPAYTLSVLLVIALVIFIGWLRKRMHDV